MAMTIPVEDGVLSLPSTLADYSTYLGYACSWSSATDWTIKLCTGTNADGFAGVILGNEAILRPIDIFVGPGIVGCKNFTTVVIRGQPMTVHTSGLFKPAIANANIVGWGVKTGVAGAITEEFVQALGFCVDFQLMYS